MQVKLLGCPGCGTEIQGAFPLGRFEALEPEQRLFLEVFLQCRGSLKDVGAALGISYPTARGRLDALIAALGFQTDAEARGSGWRLRVLEQLKRGEITTDEALKYLQGGTFG
jgi:hypothetical protein